MRKYKHLLRFFLISWVVLCIFALVILNLVDLPLGTRIGHGIFLIKGYYEETMKIGGIEKRTIVTEQGLGIYTFPFATSVLLTMIYGLFSFMKEKELKDE